MIKHIFTYVFTLCLIAFCSASVKADTWGEAGNYELSWYTTEPDLYIHSESEFAGMAYLINNNFTDFAGQTIHIMSDLDLSPKTWIPIGHSYPFTFKGSIDGHNHTVRYLGVAEVGRPLGLIGQMSNGTIKSLSVSGSISTNDFYSAGLLVGSANDCDFEDICVKGEISLVNQTTSLSTDWGTEIYIGGVAGAVSNCRFTDVIAEFSQKLIFGKSNGSSCFGYVKLYAGSIVGYGQSGNKYLRCEGISSFDNTLYGYNSPSSYSIKSGSRFCCGGIIGFDNSSNSTFVSCFGRVQNYMGSHLSGNFDTAVFYIGGIGYLTGRIENSVSIIDSYNVKGHDYSWVASWYHTSVLLHDCGKYRPGYIAGCYINNDIDRTTSKIKGHEIKFYGSTSFAKELMNTQSFLDELNLYSRLYMDGVENWEIVNGKLALKHPSDDNNAVPTISLDTTSADEVEYYTLSGLKISYPVSPGIYIRRQGAKSKKIVY